MAIVDCVTAVLDYDRLTAVMNREPPDTLDAVLDFDSLQAGFGEDRLDVTFSELRLTASMGCK